MNFEIGIDLVEKSRIKAILNSNIGTKFIDRVMTKNEQIFLQNDEKDISILAKKWAAKEAISKCLGCGIGEQISFLDIEILNDEFGKPYVKILKNEINTPNFSGKGKDVKIKISISDTKENAVAVCILEI